jgi:hypothetical protein
MFTQTVELAEKLHPSTTKAVVGYAHAVAHRASGYADKLHDLY